MLGRRTDHRQSLELRAETVLFKQEAVRWEGLLATDRLQAVTDGSSDGEELSQDWKKGAPEDRNQGQTLPLRQVPQAKPEACQDAGPLVLPELHKAIRGFSSV